MHEESWLKSDDTDTLILVKVKTRQIEDAIIINHENLVVTVTVPPVQGKANKRLIRLLKKKFKTEVILEAGQVSSNKVFRLKNLSPKQILEFLKD